MTAALLSTLHISLDRWIRPEDLLSPSEQLLEDCLSSAQRYQCQEAQVQAKHFKPFGWSSMPRNIHRPDSPDLGAADLLFDAVLPPEADRTNTAQLGKCRGKSRHA